MCRRSQIYEIYLENSFGMRTLIGIEKYVPKYNSYSHLLVKFLLKIFYEFLKIKYLKNSFRNFTSRLQIYTLF